MGYGVERSTTLGGSNKLCSRDEDSSAWCTFSTLQHADQRPSLPPLQLIPCEMNHRSSLAMPYPKHPSHYPQLFRVVTVAYIAVAGSDLWRQILALHRTNETYLVPQWASHRAICAPRKHTPGSQQQQQPIR